MKNLYYSLLIIVSLAIVATSCIEKEIIETYTVTFKVTPATASVELNGASYEDASGTVVIPLISAGKANYTVRNDGYYPKDGSIVVEGDMTQEVTLEKVTDKDETKNNFNVTFIINPVDQGDVEGAHITFDGVAYQDISNTGSLTVKYVEPKSNIPYIITKEGYKNYSGEVSVVDQDVSVTIDLISNNQDMVFSVTPGATVKMGGKAVKDEDNDGSVTIRNILLTQSVPYVVAKVGYAPVEGEIAGETFNPNTDLPINTGALVAADEGSWIDIRDGNVYSWTKIDTLIWMSENIKFNIGANVADIQVGGADFPQFGPNPTTDAYTRDKTQWWFANDSLTNSGKGRLYSFAGALAAAENTEGWYLPNWKDYQSLGRTLGISEADLNGGGWKGVDIKAGEQLMSTSWGWDEGVPDGSYNHPGGTIHPGTDLWGFKAIPAGAGAGDFGGDNAGKFDGSTYEKSESFAGYWLNSISASYGGTCMALVLLTDDYWFTSYGAGIMPSNQPMNKPMSVRLVMRTSDLD